MTVDLSQESLAKVLEDIQLLYDEQPELSLHPSHILIQSRYIWLADRILNPWKGHRAAWLYHKRR